MVHIIIRRSERELRERAMEEAPPWARGKVSGYARDIEEADRVIRETGRDKPRAPFFCDDGGKADRELRERTARSMGVRLEAYE